MSRATARAREREREREGEIERIWRRITTSAGKGVVGVKK